MAYVPKKRKLKVRWKVAGPMLVLLLLFLYMGYHVLFDGTRDEPAKYTVCGFSEKKTSDTLAKSFKETYALSDYLMYGESLNLLTAPYNPEAADAIVGKTIQLNNICTGEKFPFSIEANIDRQIALDELTEGYYEVYIIDELKEKRAVYASDLHDTSFTTIKRKGKVNQISLFADINLLKDYDKKLKERYLFLEVKQQNPKKGDVDVILDPAAFNRDFGGGVDRGAQGNDLIEYQENFKFAQRLKEQLETYGLRVKLTRDNVDDIVETYGENGRLAKAYAANARYFIHIGLNESEYDSVQGMEIYYSAHASATFANSLLYDLKKNTQLSGNTAYAQDLDTAGVMGSNLVEGKDGRKCYDGDMYIRESGGRATQAAMYSENSENGNASFAKDNIHGMLSVSIYYGYLSNKQDAAYWRDHSQTIADESAKSIAKFLRCEKSEEK